MNTINENVNILSNKISGRSILESILISRGIQDINEYLSPETKTFSSPYMFSDMEKAVEIINSAINNHEMILVWGDFDADGVTSTSILYKALTALNANFMYFMPDRMNLGHGINLKELLKLKAKNNVKVLITVDCGISNIKEISLIKSMGVKVIVTDHHEPPEILPAADCILNPLAPNSIKPNLSVKEIKDISCLSGAGVAFKLACALLQDKFPNVLDEITILSSVGTIADVVPLVGENRIIASHGINLINEGKHFGIRKLFEKLNFERPVKSEDVAFILAPRINSAGRLSTPNDAIKLLIDENRISIDTAIEKLNNLNSIRQGLCEKTYDQALSMLKTYSDSIVLFNPDWHIGVIGIVASKLVEKFNLPVFLITMDENKMYRCSARGVEGLDISKILSLLSDCFVGFGGHTFAGGFTADSAAISLDVLQNKINETILNLKDDSKASLKLSCDIELSADDITFDLIDDIEKMEPFGANNEKPKFLFRNAKVVSQKTIGKDMNHLSYSVLKDDKQFNCLYWKRKILGFNQGDSIDFIFRLEPNNFNGEERIQLITETILNDKLDDTNVSSTKLFDHRQKTGILDKIDEYVKNKNGEVKILAYSVGTKKVLDKYINIKNNIISNPCKLKTLMLFDYPPSVDEFKHLIKMYSPNNLHIMNASYSKNPDDYFSLVCGMLKYASNNKNGEIDIKTISNLIGLNEICVQIILELLEKIESIRIDDVDKIYFIKAPNKDDIHNDSIFEIFKDEFDKVIAFKDYIKCAPLSDIEEICKN